MVSTNNTYIQKIITALNNKFITKSDEAGLVKNDGTIDKNQYLTSAAVPSKTSDLTNDSGFLTSHNPIDSSLSTTSTNAVQNKVIKEALDGKSDTGHTHNYAASNHNHDGTYLKTLPSHNHDDRYYTESEIQTNYATKDHTHSNYLTSHQDISGKEDTSNKVSYTTGFASTDANLSDTKYPSERLVKKSLDGAISTHNNDAHWGTFTELSGLITAAIQDQEDIISLTKNYKNSGEESVIEIIYDITINGNGYTIDANGRNGIFRIAGCTANIENAQLIHSTSGAIQIDSYSAANISNCVFSDNSNYNGGAITIDSDSIVTINNSKFNNNISEESGGAIATLSSLKIFNSEFKNNQADYDGGAICIAGGPESDININIDNSIFNNNTATHDSGAIHSYYCNILSINCQFLTNLDTISNNVTNIPYSQEGHTHTKNQITDFPTLSTVATSGSYNDLSNKPTLSTVATSGSYNDLSNKPTIPTGSSTATDIKVNGSQSAGSSSKFAKADHIHPTDTSRAASNHGHSGYATTTNNHARTDITKSGLFSGSNAVTLTVRNGWGIIQINAKTSKTLTNDTQISNTIGSTYQPGYYFAVPCFTASYTSMGLVEINNNVVTYYGPDVAATKWIRAELVYPITSYG